MLKRFTRSAGLCLLAAALVLAVLGEVLTALAVDTETGDVQRFRIAVSEVSEVSEDGFVDVAGALVPQPAAGASSHLARVRSHSRGLNDVLIGPVTEGPAGLTSTDCVMGPAVPV